MTVKQAQLDYFPLRPTTAHVLGRLGREGLELGGGRLPIGSKLDLEGLEPYLKLPDLPVTDGPDYITITLHDFGGMTIKQTLLRLEALFAAPYAAIGCRPLARRLGLDREDEARRILARCERITALLRRAGFDVKELLERIRG